MLNDYTNDFEDMYLERVLYVSSKSALSSLANYSRSRSLTKIKVDLIEVMTNGTINGAKIDEINGDSTMENHTLNELIGLMQNTTKTVGISVQNIEVSVENITQYDGTPSPFNVIIYFEASYEIQTKNNLSWKRKIEKISNVSIYGMQDPIYGDIINNTWVIDKGVGSCGSNDCIYTEESFINKMLNVPVYDGLGICPKEEECDVT